MKKLSVKKDVECMACLACERACSEAYYKEYDPAKSCIHIGEKAGVVKPAICVQCGKCAKVCEAGAIAQNPKTGVYMVNKKLCVGCGKCKEVCPFGAIVFFENAPNAFKCIACGICAKACPMGVLEVIEK